MRCLALTDKVNDMSDRDKKYADVLKNLPDEIVSKFILPLADKDPVVHDHIVRFLMIINEKGYCIADR